MASDGLNLDELVDFTDQLVSVARSTPKLAKKFLLKEGTKLAQKTKARAKREVGTNHKKPAKYADSPHYVDTIKRGKFYFYRGSHLMAIRAYSTAPHAHLIEYGHLIKSHGESTGKFVPGKLIFDKTRREFASEYAADSEKFLDEALAELDT